MVGLPLFKAVKSCCGLGRVKFAASGLSLDPTAKEIGRH
jgi:hypothetical protein